MKTSDDGMFALALHEGIVPAPYLDPVGVWTFGLGHTAAAGLPDPSTMPKGNPADRDAAVRQAVRQFRKDLSKYEGEVEAALRVPVAQHQFDALVSFHFNTGGIARATLTRLINSGDMAGAADAFMGWRKPASIIPRREAEQRLFREGVYPSGRVPIYEVTSANKVGRATLGPGRADFLAVVKQGPGLRPAPRPVPASPVQSSPLADLWAAVLAIFKRGKT